jgi:exodeoxyribonuclease VII large subunit
VGHALLRDARHALHEASTELRTVAPQITARPRARFASQAARLDALSPLAVLSRGYAIALHEPSGKALVDARAASIGDSLRLVLHRGQVRATVDQVDENPTTEDDD